MDLPALRAARAAVDLAVRVGLPWLCLAVFGGVFCFSGVAPAEETRGVGVASRSGRAMMVCSASLSRGGQTQGALCLREAWIGRKCAAGSGRQVQQAVDRDRSRNRRSRSVPAMRKQSYPTARARRPLDHQLTIRSVSGYLPCVFRDGLVLRWRGPDSAARRQVHRVLHRKTSGSRQTRRRYLSFDPTTDLCAVPSSSYWPST